MFQAGVCSLCVLLVSVAVASAEETCEDCKVNFNNERSAATSEAERCQALMNYITCRTNTSTSWPGCSLTDNEGWTIREYLNAIPNSCVLSDTCDCQMERWMNTQNYYKAKTYQNYLSCLYEATMPGCDGVSPPSSLLDTAQLYMSDYLRTKADCDEKYMGYIDGQSDKCRYIQEYISCLGEDAASGQGLPLNQTESAELQGKLDNVEYCEISMTDTCQCQKAFIMGPNTDACTASIAYVSCSDNSYMSGCNGENAAVVREMAKLLKSQNCPDDPDYTCTGHEACYVDMSALTKANYQETESCSSMRSYISCLENSSPSLCTPVNSTLKHLKEKIMRNKLYCNEHPPAYYTDYMFTTEEPFSYSTGYPTAYPSAYPSAYPTAYPTAYPSAYPTAYPSAYPSAYPTAYPSAYPSAYPTANPSPYPSPYPSQSTVTALGAADKMMLMVYIESAKLEAEETMHAAEEAVEAINTARNLMQN